MQAEQKTSKFSGGTDFFQYPGASAIKFLIRQLPLDDTEFSAIFGSRYFNKLHLIFRLFDLRCLPAVPC